MKARSARGLWLTARQPSGKLREPWAVETQPLLEELVRREAASKQYHSAKYLRAFGPNSKVTRTNEEMLAHIRLVLEQRDGAGVPF